MRQGDVLAILRAGGRMTVPEIVDALRLDPGARSESRVRALLRRLRDKGAARPILPEGDPEGRLFWEAVQ